MAIIHKSKWHLACISTIYFLVILHANALFAHPGRINASGCHAGKLQYHCHNNNSSKTTTRKKGNEAYHNQLFCAEVGGQTEIRHSYKHANGISHIKVDCETSDTVYEGGLDKRSSLDSVQQALFFASLTGKKPAVVIYDTDGILGRFEHRIMKACELAGVQFINH